MQLADTPSPQSATLGLHPVAVDIEGHRQNAATLFVSKKLRQKTLLFGE